mmetsp:Transcript_13296/g.43313  ORF Transcript_13296/g.43313 Transcript_13296/m.43313 type:complete len:580 (-) Transcript_13296:81-1820(-)
MGHHVEGRREDGVLPREEDGDRGVCDDVDDVAGEDAAGDDAEEAEGQAPSEHQSAAEGAVGEAAADVLGGEEGRLEDDAGADGGREEGAEDDAAKLDLLDEGVSEAEDRHEDPTPRQHRPEEVLEDAVVALDDEEAPRAEGRDRRDGQTESRAENDRRQNIATGDAAREERPASPAHEGRRHRRQQGIGNRQRQRGLDDPRPRRRREERSRRKGRDGLLIRRRTHDAPDPGPHRQRRRRHPTETPRLFLLDDTLDSVRHHRANGDDLTQRRTSPFRRSLLHHTLPREERLYRRHHRRHHRKDGFVFLRRKERNKRRTTNNSVGHLQAMPSSSASSLTTKLRRKVVVPLPNLVGPAVGLAVFLWFYSRRGTTPPQMQMQMAGVVAAVVSVVDGTTRSVELQQSDGKALSFDEAMTHLGESGADFSSVLGAVPFDQFYWECPPVSGATVATTPFRCVVVEKRHPYPEADPVDFDTHLRGADKAAAFPNLGRDAMLVAPTPAAADRGFAHLADFCRNAPKPNQDRLWQLVAQTFRATLRRHDDKPLWLSTAGDGVPWLHVRIDSRPKYYHTRAFKEWPQTPE